MHTNIFTLSLKRKTTFSNRRAIDQNTGAITENVPYVLSYAVSEYIYFTNTAPICKINILKDLFLESGSTSCNIYLYTENKTFIRKVSLTSLPDFIIDDCYFIAIQLFNFTVTEQIKSNVCEIETFVKPHYKNISKHSKKDSGQMLFRDSIEGSISLFNNDYWLIKNADLSAEMVLNIYSGEANYNSGNILVSGAFSKTDCEFDLHKMSVKLSFSENDVYANSLNKKDETFDIVKLAPEITKLRFTKRCLLQFYAKGGNSITNVFGASYWEDEVNEPIDDETQLSQKYHFSKNMQYNSVVLTGLPGYINAEFHLINGSSEAVGVCIEKTLNGDIIKHVCKLKLVQVTLHAGFNPQMPRGWSGLRKLSDYSYIRALQIGDTYYAMHLYVDNVLSRCSTCMYDSGDLGLMTPDPLSYPLLDVNTTYVSFNVGDYMYENQIWVRLLSARQYSDSGILLCNDLPYDDFATERENFKYCAGVTFSGTQLVRFEESQSFSVEPTSYGQNDFQTYFLPPSPSSENDVIIPILQNEWINTSIWIHVNPDLYEQTFSSYYIEAELKDSYHISSVIKKILAKVSPNITHEATPEYSEYLYGQKGISDLGGCQIYITPKSNILKGGTYDIAAQKGEFTLDDITNLLSDAFRCYWFIDDQNRFRIEHISYFINGQSYILPTVQYDLTSKYDKFNKKNVLYDQYTITYNKTELTSRFEFSWMDEVTDAMGNTKLYSNVSYTKQDSTKSVNLNKFCSDIDFMLFAPSKFSQDGFALLLARDKVIPIEEVTLCNERQNNAAYNVYVQNWYASFNNLIKLYMYDAPSYDVTCNIVPQIPLLVKGLSRSMQHKIRFQPQQLPSMYNIIKTDLGNGTIEDISVDIDTFITDVTLSYEI